MCYNSCPKWKNIGTDGRCTRGKGLCVEEVDKCEICGDEYHVNNFREMYHRSTSKEIYVCDDCYNDAIDDGYEEIA